MPGARYDVVPGIEPQAGRRVSARVAAGAAAIEYRLHSCVVGLDLDGITHWSRSIDAIYTERGPPSHPAQEGSRQEPEYYGAAIHWLRYQLWALLQDEESLVHARYDYHSAFKERVVTPRAAEAR